MSSFSIIEEMENINRKAIKKIKKFNEKHPNAYAINLHRYTIEKLSDRFERDQNVYTFEFDFLIPEYNSEVEKILNENRRINNSSLLWNAEKQTEVIDKIYKLITDLNGEFLFWR